MRGYPKHLNSKQDYLNCLGIFPEETKKDLQRLLNDRFVWTDTEVLEDATGITDDTHRVIDTEDVRIQQELREDEHAEIYRLGFTVEEVEELLK